MSGPLGQPYLSPRHVANFQRLQLEASRLPGARHLGTPYGSYWMSPIEADLYAALLRAGLAPIPQFCVEGFFLDFAFPTVRLGVEADGSVHLGSAVAERDHWRDRILRRNGWAVLRFHGSTIFHRADNCAYVVQGEFESRLRTLAEAARREEQYRFAVREAWRHHPIRTFLRMLIGRDPVSVGLPSSGRDPPAGVRLAAPPSAGGAGDTAPRVPEPPSR